VKLPVDAIYFISLPKASQRRNRLFQTIRHITDIHGNAPQWHKANDGNNAGHVIDNSLKRSKKRPNMSLGEIGCCASHREVWTKIVQNGHQSALVLEDDARFEWDKLIELVTNWNSLPEFDFLHLGWEYYAGYKEQTIEKVAIPELPNLWKGDGMWLTHAYIITNHCALNWLQKTIVQTNGLDAMTADMQSDCRAYGFKPCIAYQERGTSGCLRSTIHHTG
jgi:GR25 family glycosyltransferase involved in LPS biosynthesis